MKTRQFIKKKNGQRIAKKKFLGAHELIFGVSANFTGHMIHLSVGNGSLGHNVAGATRAPIT